MIDRCGCEVQASLVMGIRLCRQRRMVDPDPEPEPSKVSAEEEQSSEAGEETVAATVEEPSEVQFQSTPNRVQTVGGVELILVNPPSAVQSLDLRFYAVWFIPRAANPRGYCGVHWGIDTAAYAGILGLNQGHFAGIRWCRAHSVDLARAVYLREARQRGVPAPFEPITIFGWQRLAGR